MIKQRGRRKEHSWIKLRHFCLFPPDVFLEGDVLGVEAAAEAEHHQGGRGLWPRLGGAHRAEQAGGGQGLALGVPGGQPHLIAGVTLQGPRHVPECHDIMTVWWQTRYIPVDKLVGLRNLLDGVISWVCRVLCDVQVIKQAAKKNRNICFS